MPLKASPQVRFWKISQIFPFTKNTGNRYYGSFYREKKRK